MNLTLRRKAISGDSGNQLPVISLIANTKVGCGCLYYQLLFYLKWQQIEHYH